jgi:outer membrane protein OmpA-like peptidoglycan-associated protein
MEMKKFHSTLVAATAVVAMLGAGAAQEAQAQSVKPAPGYNGAIWRFGVLGGLNYNLLGLGTQEFGGEFYNQGDKVDGKGLGPYGGLLIEFNDGSRLGAHVRATYDSRYGNADLRREVNSPVLGEVGLNVAYLNIEPALRVNFNPNFHLLVGPSLGIKIASKYDVDRGDFVGDDSASVARTNAIVAANGEDIYGMNNIAIGLWGGLGYDFLLNDESSSSRIYLTPFVEGSWIWDQRTGVSTVTPSTNNSTNENIDDVWSTVTFRGGLQFKFGSGPVAPLAQVDPIVEPARDMIVSVRPPAEIIENRQLTEYFPLRNYVFFDQGSTEMPAKYTRLASSTAATFNESTFMNQPGAGGSSNMSPEGRSERQMSVYYNGLNIFATRLKANPTATLELYGNGANATESQAMATAVKDYMVSTFGLDAGRITTKTGFPPGQKAAAGDNNTPKEDRDLVAIENRRVTLWSANQEVMKPVMLMSTTSDIVDNDLVLNVDAASNVDSWRVTIEGNGYRETYGPFRRNSQRIGAAPILGTGTRGTYTARFEGTTADGKTMTKEQTFTLTKRASGTASTAQRYSILFEFDDNNAISVYENFLKNEVAPKIGANATVYVHGHTDEVGLEDYNLDLSARRANEVKAILEKATSGKSVKYESYGFGEADNRAPFTNERPEGRYYNRTVIIDVVNR